MYLYKIRISKDIILICVGKQPECKRYKYMNTARIIEIINSDYSGFITECLFLNINVGGNIFYG